MQSFFSVCESSRKGWQQGTCTLLEERKSPRYQKLILGATCVWTTYNHIWEGNLYFYQTITTFLFHSCKTNNGKMFHLLNVCSMKFCVCSMKFYGCLSFPQCEGHLEQPKANWMVWWSICSTVNKHTCPVQPCCSISHAHILGKTGLVCKYSKRAIWKLFHVYFVYINIQVLPDCRDPGVIKAQDKARTRSILCMFLSVSPPQHLPDSFQQSPQKFFPVLITQ